MANSPKLSKPENNLWGVDSNKLRFPERMIYNIVVIARTKEMGMPINKNKRKKKITAIII